MSRLVQGNRQDHGKRKYGDRLYELVDVHR
jgi:hypothetical protein